MCLNKITAKNRNLSGKGWKVFIKIPSRPDYYTSPYFCTLIPVGIWTEKKSEPYETIINNGIEYKSGFHIFKYKKDAECYSNVIGLWLGVRVKKVKYRKAHTYGLESGFKTVVADEIYIEE